MHSERRTHSRRLIASGYFFNDVFELNFWPKIVDFTKNGVFAVFWGGHISRPLAEPRFSAPATWEHVAALTILTFLAALYLAWPMWRASLPLEIDVNEPWNAYHADAARLGRPLYPDPDGLVANNYPPLSFYLIGAMASLGGDTMYIGRVLSLLAVLSLAVAAGWLVRQFGGGRASSFLAGLWFLATMSRFFTPYIGMNDPHLMALAIMAWALIWLIRRHREGRAVEPAIVLMVVAGFFKHNLIAIPLTAILWLAIKDRRLAVRAAIVGGAAVLSGLALCGAAYGEAFFRHMLMPREYSLVQALASLGRLQWIAPAIAIFVLWAYRHRHVANVQFAWLFITVAFVVHFLQRLGAGVDDNAQFELTLAAALGLGLTASRLEDTLIGRRWGIARAQAILVLILIGRLLASSETAPYRLAVSSEFRTMLREQVVAMNAKVDQMASMPGPVVCPVMTVCRQAGKPFVFDAFAVDQRVKTGKLSLEELQRRIHIQNIRFIQVDPSCTSLRR